MFSPSGSATAAPANIVIFQRQLRRATRQLWLFTSLAVFDALLVIGSAAAGNGVGAIEFGVVGIILLALAAFLIPYRRRLKRAIAQAGPVSRS